MIRLSGIRKTYRHPRQVALDGIDLDIPSGALYGLLGPNGAGKTTLIHILAGILAADGGEIRIDGRPRRPGRVASDIALVPQDLAFYPTLSVAENLRFYAAAAGVPARERTQRIEQAVSTAELQNHLRKPAEHLSGGLKRRLNLAIGLLGSPRVLVLDEPTVGIDPQSRHFILETLRRLNAEGMTLLYASHYMEEVEQLCRHVAIIDHGRILCAGEVGELLARGAGQSLQAELEQAPGPALRRALEERCGARFDTAQRLAIDTDRPGETLQDLDRMLREAGVGLRCARYGCASLEALFLQLTRHTLRD
ncbi:ABC transporter ATP-binding protein [Acidihalobacter prosperus]